MKRCNQCWKRKPAREFRGRFKAEVQDCADCRAKKRRGEAIGRHPDLDAPGDVRILWNERSFVNKLGGLPTSSSSGSTCPDACALKGAGCYAEYGIGGAWWRALSSGKAPPRGGGPIGITWGAFLEEVADLPPGQLWRHNLAGDLPGKGNRIAGAKLRELVAANEGRRGFTFTHKPLTTTARHALAAANDRGFAVNVSADNMRAADRAVDLELPAAVVVPHGAPVRLETPKGRAVHVCPAQRDPLATCATCGWCARIHRDWIVGFRAHGQAKRAISLRVIS